MPRPFLSAYPTLAEALPHYEFCELSTPVTRLEAFGKAVGHPEVYIKRDDISGPLYGGNKVRTLEFLLPRAKSHSSNVVLGIPGASMAIATNIYAKHFDIPLRTILIHSRPTTDAQRHLRYFQHLDAELYAALTLDEAEEQRQAIAQTYGDINVLSPLSPLGMCGYINAAFELKEQIDQGIVPKPDYLVISASLMGTAAGLMLGFRAAGIHIQVLVAHNGVNTYEGRVEERAKLAQLYNAASTFLHDLDPTFPDVQLEPYEVMLRSESKADPGYYIRRGRQWITHMQELEDIVLDATWTGPAIATLEKEIKSGFLKDKRVLFWHTLNSRPYPEVLETIDYKSLPAEFHEYFETHSLAVVNKPRFLA